MKTIIEVQDKQYIVNYDETGELIRVIPYPYDQDIWVEIKSIIIERIKGSRA